MIAEATGVEIVEAAADVLVAEVAVDVIAVVVTAVVEVAAVGTAEAAAGTKDFLETRAATLLRLFHS